MEEENNQENISSENGRHQIGQKIVEELKTTTKEDITAMNDASDDAEVDRALRKAVLTSDKKYKVA